MTTTTLKTALMTSVYAGNSTKNYEDKTKHGIGTGSGGALIDYVYFSKPVPSGATVISARLIFYTDAQTSGAATHTITAARLGAPISMTKVTYKTRPTSALAGTVSATKFGSYTAGAEWTVDVTTHMQAIANGEAWYGWQLTGNMNPNRNIYGPRWGTSSQRPRLEVTWAMLPGTPASLSPGGGRLVSVVKPTVRATYTDIGNDNPLGALQVQRSDGNADFSTVTWDSGIVAATSAQLDTSTTSMPGLVEGVVYWWRMRVQDTNGVWSLWSGAESFGYDAKAALEILNPAPSPNNFVTEDSPPITWLFPYGGPEKVTNTDLASNTYVNPAAGTGGTASLTTVSSGSYDGTAFARLTWTVAPTATTSAGFIYSLSGTTPDPGLTATAGVAYDASAYVRPSIAQTVLIGATFYDAANAIIGTSYTNSVAVPAATWQQVAIRTPVAPANAVRLRLHFYGTSTIWPVASTFDLDSISVRGVDTSEAQSAYQVDLVDPVTGVKVWGSGKVTSTSTTGFNLPSGKLKVLGATYRVVVSVWDQKMRETTPGDTAYVQVVRDFTYNLTTATGGTTGLVATPDAVRPKVALTWGRSTFPDSFTVLRNGVVIASELVPGDISLTATTFTWTDPAPSPNVALTYQVAAVVNSKSSSGNATATVTLTTLGMWLATKDRSTEVLVVGKDARSWTYGEQSEVLEVIGGTEVVVVTHAQRGLEGTISGQLRTGMLGLSTTAQEWKANLLALRTTAGTGQQLWLTAGDATIPVVIREVVVTPRPEPVLAYDVSFEFYQVAAL